jgi:hypothetical protein
MANDDPASGGNTVGGAGDDSGGAAGDQGTSGAKGVAATNAKAVQSHPAFVGFLFPAHLDENGNEMDTGPGKAHFLACVFPYEKSQASPDTNVHEKVDKVLGQPLFSAFLYPNPLLNNPGLDLHDVLGGGPGGHAPLGGAPNTPVLYTGKFHAFIPVDDEDDEG